MASRLFRRFRAALDEARTLEAKIVVDLTRADFVDPSGFGAVADTSARSARGARWAWSLPGERGSAAATLSDFRRHLNVYATTADAP